MNCTANNDKNNEICKKKSANTFCQLYVHAFVNYFKTNIKDQVVVALGRLYLWTIMDTD